MPLFDFRCDPCNLTIKDEYVKSSEQTFIECPNCCLPMRRLFPNRLGPTNFGWPEGGLTLEHVAANPVHFDTRKQAQDYAKAHNLELGCLL